MMQLANKKFVKAVSLSIALLFVLGIVAAFAVQGTGIAQAEGSSNVGIINVQMVITQSPDFPGIQKQLQDENNSLQKEFESRAGSMTDNEKRDYAQQLEQKMQQKQQELLVPLYDKINATIKKVADAKGLSVVVDRGAVVYGGVDITDDVIKALGAAK
ncbi:MAG: OmpH family outer membrane protein [Negativicutes bacterium]|nr:OmpH family outer membrane protein [Negativicutes bacterium]